MVAEQAFLAPRAPVDPSSVAAATAAVAAVGEIGGGPQIAHELST